MVRFNLCQTQELLTGQSGLALVGALLEKTDWKTSLNNLEMPVNRSTTLENSDIATSMVGLLVQGRCDFDHIELFREDPFFCLALNLTRTPSAPILRQRLDMATEKWDATTRRTSLQLLKNHAIQTPCYKEYIPLDVDVSPMDNSGTKKEGVNRTYKQFDGYAPLFVYIGQEGYMLNLDFREGSSHSQCEGTVAFFEDTFSMLPELAHKKYLFRADSAHDCLANYQLIQQFNKKHPEIRLDCIVKGNLRRESKLKWLELAKERGVRTKPRKGKAVYIGKITRTYDGLDEPLTLVFKVTERTILSNGQCLLIPEVEVETYKTMLHDEEPKQIIELYHHHGTSEQFHSELKTDIGLERLPSGRFATNQRIMFLTMLAFNLLRIMGQESLCFEGNPIRGRHRIKRRRLRSVIQDIIFLASRLIRHSRQWTLGFGRQSPFYETFGYLYFLWAG
jgi:hypothetical protein